MKIEKIIESVQNAVDGMNLSSDNLILAIVKLLELARAEGFENDAKKILADCGIILEISEE